MASASALPEALRTALQNAGNAAQARPAADESDLNAVINYTQTECLNCADPGKLPWEACLKQGLRDVAEVGVESDCDEQLLLNVGFAQQVRITHIAIEGPEDNGPKTVKLYVNKTSAFGFDDVDSTKPGQVLNLTPGSGSNRVALDLLTFRCVTSLSVFVEDNHNDSDVTKLSSIRFIGLPLDTTNVSELKKC